MSNIETATIHPLQQEQPHDPSTPTGTTTNNIRLQPHQVDPTVIKRQHKAPFHQENCCSGATQCLMYGSAILLKQNLLYRLLYTNPVCLLTTAQAPLLSVSTPNPLDANHIQLQITKTQALRHENCMTITWLTPTDNNGNIFLSMNIDRFSLKNLLASKRFVLNIPVANGLEDTIKSIGKCSGSAYKTTDDSDQSSSDMIDSKFKQFNLTTSSLCYKNNPLLTLGDLSNTTSPPQSSSPSSDTILPTFEQSTVDNILDDHIHQIIKRNYNGIKTPQTEEYINVFNEIKKSLQFGDICLNDCVAHVICEVTGIISPLVDGNGDNDINHDIFNCNTDKIQLPSHGYVGQIAIPQHVSIFAKMKLGSVRHKYWHHGLFQPQNTDLPPSLTFLGQGAFLHSTPPSK